MDIRTVAWRLFALLLIGAAFAVLWYAASYLLVLWAAPAIIHKVVLTVLVACGAMIFIDWILGWVGKSYIVWR